MTPGYWFLAGLGLIITLIVFDAYMRRSQHRPLSRMRPDRLNEMRAPLGQEAIDREAFASSMAMNEGLAKKTGASAIRHSWTAAMAVPPVKVDSDGNREKDNR
jgi:hypothetical protein